MLKHQVNRIGMAVAILLSCVTGVGAQQKPFTLEQVMSSAFPTALVAAPAGGKVAWVLDVFHAAADFLDRHLKSR